jgi:hydrogenase/urease accessory protein HupE
MNIFSITLRIFIVAILFFIACVPQALAHDASLTYSSVVIKDKSIDVTLNTPYTNILKLYPEPDKTITEIDPRFFKDQFQKGFIIENNNSTCTPVLKEYKNIPDIKALSYHFTFTCNQPIEKLHFLYKLFFTVSQTHENITDIHIGNTTEQVIFSSTKHVYAIDYKAFNASLYRYQLFTTIITFLKTGVIHILTGYDHILFLVALLLVTKRFRSLLKIITSFTIAHSITLSIAALGIFLLPARFTESMIALSIVYVAFENLFILSPAEKVQPHIGVTKLFLADTSKRWMIAFLFGLIHGFGFSSVLREIGLPKQEIASSLISFNVGVELGQLAIIALVYPLVWYIQKKSHGLQTIKVISIIISLLGGVWFIQRVFLS